MDGMLQIIKEVGIAGVVDIAVMALILYSILVWFQRTRAVFVLSGIIIVAVVYIFAHQLGLLLLATVLQAFFAVILVALVVIFQEELRHFFEQIAVWGLNRKLGHWKKIRSTRKEVEILVRALTHFSEEKIGALIVLQGKNPILRHLSGGIDLDGELSEPLLKSLFDPHSIGHDGALIIDKGRVLEFSCHLPLSKNFQKLKYSGTRHAAALGLSELTDALCLVVSEEQGTILVVRHGHMRQMDDPEDLTHSIEDFYQEIQPKKQRKIIADLYSKNYREKVLAFLLSAVLWFFMVHESKLVQRNYILPVEYANMPNNMKLVDMQPDKIQVKLSGPRRNFYFSKDKIRLQIRLFDVDVGEQVVPLSYSDISIPEGTEVEYFEPQQIKVHISSQTR